MGDKEEESAEDQAPFYVPKPSVFESAPEEDNYGPESDNSAPSPYGASAGSQTDNYAPKPYAEEEQGEESHEEPDSDSYDQSWDRNAQQANAQPKQKQKLITDPFYNQDQADNPEASSSLKTAFGGSRWFPRDNIGDSGNNRRIKPSRFRRPVASWLSDDASDTKSIRRTDTDVESSSDEVTEDPNLANHAPASSEESDSRSENAADVTAPVIRRRRISNRRTERN